MEEEPHGEERQDLRIGALGSILLNTTLDTRDEGPLLPDSYIAGWDNERTFYLTVKSPQLLEEERLARERGEVREQQSGGRKLDLNDPVGWENFAVGLRKMAHSLKDN